MKYTLSQIFYFEWRPSYNLDVISLRRKSQQRNGKSVIIVCTVPTLTSNCALIVSIDTWQSLSINFFIWPIRSSVLTSLLPPQLSSSLPSLNRVEKYAGYFKDGEILPVPESFEAVEPQILSFIVIDLRTKRLAGLKKETFEDIFKSENITGKYFCRRCFASWDVLLPSEEGVNKNWLVVISPIVSSGCNRNIEANAGSRSPYAMSRCN